VTLYKDKDAGLLSVGLLRFRDQIQSVAVFVEGCKGATKQTSCNMQNTSVATRRNECLFTARPIYNGTTLISNETKWFHPHGHAMQYIADGSVQSNPACLEDGRPGTCPCCIICTKVLTAIQEQLDFVDASNDATSGMEVLLKNPWAFEEVQADLVRAAQVEFLKSRPWARGMCALG